MTTKLLPRLIATAALATALTGISAVSGLVTSAHATPLATQGPDGSIVVTLPYTDVQAATGEMSNAHTLCRDSIVPTVDTISPHALPVTTCTTYTHFFAEHFLSSGKSVQITYSPDGKVSGRTV
jgi:hypothetical protein